MDDLLKSDLTAKAPPEEIAKWCNGCGLLGKLGILNVIMGVDVKEACCLHDYEYHIKYISRELADWYFYQNMKFIIDASDLKPARKAIARQCAWVYFLTVRTFGAFAYDIA